jgi:AraC family transcriptional regulator
MPEILSYLDWYRDGLFASAPQVHRSLMPPAQRSLLPEARETLVPQVDRSIQAGPVHVINVSPPAGAVVEPPVPEYALHLLLRTAPLLRVGFNRRPRWLAVSPGAMLLAPPDTACEYVADDAAHVLTIAIPKARVEEFTEDSGGRVDIRHEEAFRDPRLVQQLVRLWHELASDAPASRLFADQVMRALLETLARRTDAHVPPRHGRERLSPHTLRRLRDYVESSLADDLDVTMMAAVAELSPAHFARAFAATLGMTPFQYVMTRRLARARELIERTHRSALDIALDVGFKTPSHFTSRFRREFGVTPRAIRRLRSDQDSSDDGIAEIGWTTMLR